MALRTRRPRPSEGQIFGQVGVRISPFGAMRRNGVRFALLSTSERGHQTLLLRPSAVLRNAMASDGRITSLCHCFHKMTWPEFRPSRPRGQVGLQEQEHSGLPTGRGGLGRDTHLSDERLRLNNLTKP